MKNLNIDNRVIFRVAELFVREKFRPQEIADRVNDEFRDLKLKLTREAIYPLLIKARELRFLKLTPPFNETMGKDIESAFTCRSGSVRVIDCPVPQSNESVSAAAAEWAFDLMKEMPPTPDGALGFGLGPGRGTLDFVKHFSQLLGGDGAVPKLNLYAISAGCPADSPGYASISFFNLFPSACVNTRLGLFAQTLIQKKDFARVQTEQGVREVFAAKADIDIVVTSMGDKDDPHGLFGQFIRACPGRPPSWFEEWVGDIQYRPYSVSGPIEEGPKDFRAVTLFELSELVSMANTKDKEVILIVRKCGLCERSKTHARALLPVLKNPSLRVFSRLVLDSDTAREVLELARGRFRTVKPERKNGPT